MDRATRTLLASQAQQLELQARAFADQAAALREALSLSPEDVTPAAPVKASTVAEVAAMLGLGESTVKAMVGAKTIPSVLFGTSRRVLSDDLVDYLSTLRQAS
ncbi:helix-turn-helix domain-containing protein [Calidifontibacter terrae]